MYTVRPLHAKQPFQVFCRQIALSRTYLMDRRKLSVTFNQSWLAYRDGFGDLQQDHWIGLEKVRGLGVGLLLLFHSVVGLCVCVCGVGGGGGGWGGGGCVCVCV